MTTVEVDLGTRSYPIHIGHGLLDDDDLLERSIAARQVVIVSNEVVAPLYLAAVRQRLPGRLVLEFILADGEDEKNLDNFARLMSFLLEHRVERGACIVALGGGVVGDLAGFAAACYQRGVGFVQIPTTLLAQVDSAVGGKTAVNHPLGKNMIGAFYQPQAVLADTDVLETLPPRELSAGLAEVIKYGLIRDRDFLDWIDQNLEKLVARDTAALTTAIRRSCENKAAVVAADERESGSRATLNLGHTFGHAIETALGYGEWLHGEAVAAGTCMAARLSARLGWLDPTEVTRIETLFRRAALPTAPPPGLTPQQFLELMQRDKKNTDGKITLILLQGLGTAVVSRDYPPAALEACLRDET